MDSETLRDYASLAETAGLIEPGGAALEGLLTGGDLILLVNYGIGGVKKHRLPVASLPELEPQAQPAPEPGPAKVTKRSRKSQKE